MDLHLSFAKLNGFILRLHLGLRLWSILRNRLRCWLCSRLCSRLCGRLCGSLGSLLLLVAIDEELHYPPYNGDTNYKDNR